MGLAGFDGGKLAKSAQTVFVAPVNDIQKVEDIHLILTHMVMQFIYKKLNA